MPEDRLIDRIKARRGANPLPVSSPASGGVVGGGAGAGAPAEESQTTMDMLNDLLKGFGKSAGETAFDLGNLVHKTPLLGNATDALAKLVGPEGTDPNSAFKTLPEDLERKGNAQKLGGYAENMAEFMIPGMAGTKAASGVRALDTTYSTVGKNITGKLAEKIDPTVSPQVLALLNKLAAYTGRIAGPAVEGGTISALKGSDHPEYTAEAGAGGAAATEGLAALMNVLKSSYGRRAATVLAASSLMGQLPGLPGNLSGMMGLYGLIRDPMKNVLEHSGTIPMLQRGVRTGGRLGTQMLEGAVDEATPKKRELGK